jgi:hypothetical protein
MACGVALTFGAVASAAPKGKAAASAKATPKGKKAPAKVVNVKQTLNRTDLILKNAGKAKASPDELREAVVHQNAARKAKAAGKDKAAVFLTLRAREKAREVMTTKGATLPKNLRADENIEVTFSDPDGSDDFLTEADAEVPGGIPADDMEGDIQGDESMDDSFEDDAVFE